MPTAPSCPTSPLNPTPRTPSSLAWDDLRNHSRGAAHPFFLAGNCSTLVNRPLAGVSGLRLDGMVTKKIDPVIFSPRFQIVEWLPRAHPTTMMLYCDYDFDLIALVYILVPMTAELHLASLAP